jgi:hypothetical protein
MSGHCHRWLAASVLVVMTAAPIGCSGGAGYETPEASFAAMKEAAKKKDFAAIYDCLSAETQDMMAGGLVMMGSMMKMMSGMAAMGGPEAAAEAEKSLGALTAVLEKHGVTEEALEKVQPDPQAMGDPSAIGKLASVVKDKRAFVADVMNVMQQSDQGGQFNDKFEENVSGELKEVKIDGNNATATLVTASGEEPIEFRKEDSGWKVHLPMDRMGSGGDAGPPPGFEGGPPPGFGAGEFGADAEVPGATMPEEPAEGATVPSEGDN